MTMQSAGRAMSKPEAEFWDILQLESVLTLATADVCGSWSAPVLYVADWLKDRPALYFLSSPSSRHIMYLPPNGAASASIYVDYTGDWQAIRGLQMQGFIGRVPDEGRVAWEAAYFARFPEISGIIHQPKNDREKKMAAVFQKSGYYIFNPTYIRSTDNSDQFASRREWHFSK